jgi:20S proteasome alpha/beta subunit
VRYSWKPKEKRTTIAAGFCLDEGVLLCSDTLIDNGVRLHDSKLHGWCDQSDNTALGFAIAGSETNARMAIEDCITGVEECELEQRTYERIVRILRKAILGITRKYVDGRPEENAFSLAIGTWIPKIGRPKLFVSNSGGLIPRQYDCLGTGWYLGHYIMRPVFHKKMGMDNAVRLAIQAVSAAKRHDPHCGGDTQFLTVSSKGVSSTIWHSIPISEHLISVYEEGCSQLLLDIGERGMTSEGFEDRLQDFTQLCQTIRTEFINARFDTLLKQVTKEGRSDLESTTNAPLRRQP